MSEMQTVEGCEAVGSTLASSTFPEYYVHASDISIPNKYQRSRIRE